MNRVIDFSRYQTEPTEPVDQRDFLDGLNVRSAYQPIFSPTHQKLVGFEALVRVDDGTRPISPVALFERAQTTRQTVQLDSFLLHRHVDNFTGREKPVWLFLNINPETCTHPMSSLDRLVDQCNECGISPEKLVLELVETASDNTDALIQFVNMAKDRGFRIAIDDFGTGDSNFERLWRIDPTIVKIDRSLLVNAEHHHRARQLLESLVRMIRESGSLVLLEGIENDAQARIALDTEADLLQGFLFGKPGIVDDTVIATQEAGLSAMIDQTRRNLLQESSDHSSFLRLLRFEILEACHRLARGETFANACNAVFEMGGVKRCFMLDANGIQQGNLAFAGRDRAPQRFNPLYRSAGACWSHREYFLNALERPQSINCSRPYVGLPDATRTVTLTTCLTSGSSRQVFCVDIHPDELFGGQLCFPATL
ncbi:EAL domain-containing protein [Marinobacter confluentis]|uniref:EAL domain-containing protein n=1 Tax=Marinobacter confluentis TaxID=1697557 RepID=A0A4Z1C0R5_9GAMM|nr:EAL domain-containing protein [Marinobacter confluentis]TGN39483.1 EAL domain-containing protein [Marinobacter confluentis]